MTFPQVVEKMKASCAKTWTSPEWRAKQSALSKITWSDCGRRQKHSKTIIQAWKNPALKALRAKLSKEIWNRPGYREAARISHATPWRNPDMRRKRAKALKAFWDARPECRASRSLEVKAHWQDPVYRSKNLEARAVTFADPKFKIYHAEKTAIAMARPETKLRVKIGRLVAAIDRQTNAALIHHARGDLKKAKRAKYLVSNYSRRLVQIRDELKKLTKLS